MYCFYTECFETWDGLEGGKGLGDDNQWQLYNVTANHNIPASAVLEVALVNEYTGFNYNMGVRSTASVGENDDFHRIRIAEAENGDSYAIMHVQLDPSGWLEYFGENVTRVHFDILGYWLGCDYTDIHAAFTPSAPSGWETYAFNQHGVGSGNVAEVVMTNAAEDIDHTLGIRESGSSYDRRFKIKESENQASAGLECLSIFVPTSGATASVEIWSSDTTDASFLLLGYFSVPPGAYNEANVIFPTPDSTSWEELDIGASGFPSNIVAQFCIGHSYTGNVDVGVRETDSTLERRLILDRQESPVTALSWGCSHSNVDGDGKLEYVCDYLPSEATYTLTGYWDEFLEAEIILPKSGTCDCFIYGLNPYIHYLERAATTLSSTLVDQWQVKDISEYIPIFALAENVTAEIVLSNESSEMPLWAGLRSVDSSLDRRYQIHASSGSNASVETVCLHVPVSADGEIEFYSDHLSYVVYNVLGIWVGATYVETTGSFNTIADSEWTQQNLDTYGVPEGKIAEVLVSHSGQWVPQSGGMREVGSSIDRLVDLSSVFTVEDGGSTYCTMLVQTSGANAAIEVYAGDKDEVSFHVVGYWDKPPGSYVELNEVITPDATKDVWKDLDITAYNVPSDSVAEIVMANTDYNSYGELGIRESGSDQERKIRWANAGNPNFCGGRWHTNVVSDGIQTFHELVSADSYFAAIGYWNNMDLIPVQVSGQASLFVNGHISHNVLYEDDYPNGLTMTMHGRDSLNASGSLFIYGVHLADTDLFIHGLDTYQASGDMVVSGIGFCATNEVHSPSYPSGVSLYMEGHGIIPESGQFNLVTVGDLPHVASGDLFIHGHTSQVASGDLFLKALTPQNASMNLFVSNSIDIGPGLIREANAIFYLKNYHDGNGSNIQEHINNQTLYIPFTMFQHSPFIGVPGETIDNDSTSIVVPPFVPTFGDGTYPHYNDLGGHNYEDILNIGGYGNPTYRTPGGGWQSSKPDYDDDNEHKQNICGTVEDYQYPGSGSITTVFWMSGAQTSGNIAEVGWFYKGAPESTDDAEARHTLGIKIEGTSGITVITSVRDLPYNQISGGGLWWGGTTHYGTPTDASWTWRSASMYQTWTEEWPIVNIEHDPITFVALHTDFIASGIDGSHPNHMKIWLSLDGQPWTYIGSGLTGPPASSVFSYSDPNNRYPENSVGVRQQGVNEFGGIVPAEVGGIRQGSIILSENVLWTDAEKFTTDELRDLHSIVDQHNRPLDEYRPTLVPTSTYIQRTIGMFTYDPTIPGIGYSPGEICSGLRVTIEVGLGDYGADASAYLLEETPPSGFYVGNIQPTTLSTYGERGTRPLGGQQIFHDPQSGVIQPYDTDVNLNLYGASIRWVNHDNHPEINQRRSPTPTGIYTYDLYPMHSISIPRVDDFEFTGSGVFFGGSTGSGLFVIQTTGDTSGTTSGLAGGLISTGCNLYIQGPSQPTDTINLYLRTQETFTSAYIGTASRTPEATDFIFAADGAAAIESMAGIEYGPPLYTRGPLAYEDSCSLVIFGPAADQIPMFIHGLENINTSGDRPSGVSLTMCGHEAIVASGDLFIVGPRPWSSGMDLYTMAGAFTSINGGAGHGMSPPLFIHGHEDGSGNCNLFIKGPEFICSSGSFSYPYDIDDFTYPYGNPSPPLFVYGDETASDTCPLYIGPPRARDTWTLHLKTADNNPNESLNLCIHGFIPASGSSGVNQTFNRTMLYLEADNADYPYTAGGTEEWTLFMKAQDGNLTDDEAWTMFLKADFTTPANCSLYTFGHAVGGAPRGIEVNDSVGLVCSVDPDDPTRIGYSPCDSHDDPWNLFLKCEPGHFGIATLYMSGAAPVLYPASGNLFVEGLFEQETNTAPLYLMGVSGMFNNGPSGLHLFLDAGILVYNTSGNLYAHGY